MFNIPQILFPALRGRVIRFLPVSILLRFSYSRSSLAEKIMLFRSTHPSMLSSRDSTVVAFS